MPDAPRELLITVRDAIRGQICVVGQGFDAWIDGVEDAAIDVLNDIPDGWAKIDGRWMRLKEQPWQNSQSKSYWAIEQGDS